MADPIPVCGVLLAAGASKRFGKADKLLADVHGTTLVAISAARLLEVGVSPVVAVVAPGPDGDAVAAALRHLPMRVAVNAYTERGMGTSVACGVTAMAGTRGGIMILPGDMPLLEDALLVSLIAAFRQSGGAAIVHPVTSHGQQRNPVIWPEWLRPELVRLEGETGGKPLLTTHREHVMVISTDSYRGLDDVDTPEDLARVLANRR